MKREMFNRLLGVAISVASVFSATGCDDLIVPNVLRGARDGALTTTTGIIKDYFESQFELEGAEEGEEEGGNELFIRL